MKFRDYTYFTFETHAELLYYMQINLRQPDDSLYTEMNPAIEEEYAYDYAGQVTGSTAGHVSTSKTGSATSNSYAAPDSKLKGIFSDIPGLDSETFRDMLLRLIDEKGMTDSECYNKAFVDRRTFGKIKNTDGYLPKKPTIYAFTASLELDVPTASELMMKAGYAFNDSSKQDMIMKFCLERRIYNVLEINEIMDYYGEPLIGAA